MQMYEAFHSQSKDLSDVDVLAALGVQTGVFDSAEQAKQWLHSDEGEYELRHAMDVANMNGVQSVPFTIVQVRLVLCLHHLTLTQPIDHC